MLRSDLLNVHFEVPLLFGFSPLRLMNSGLWVCVCAGGGGRLDLAVLGYKKTAIAPTKSHTSRGFFFSHSYDNVALQNVHRISCTTKRFYNGDCFKHAALFPMGKLV